MQPQQINLPFGFSPVAVAAGSSHSLAIGNDGKLYAWGSNVDGQLGDGTAVTIRRTPVQINLPTGVSPLVVAGSSHSLAIGSDRKLYAWGYNFYGQLGDGANKNQTAPVQVNLPGRFSPLVVAAAAGEYHSMAIGSNGGLYAWGYNFYGQLGDGTNVNKRTPVLGVTLPQTISFLGSFDRTLGTAPFNITATATSGLAVSFASTTPAVCSVSGNTVTLVTLGTCTITANQAGNASYSPAPQATRSFNVIQSQTISFEAISDRELDDSPFTIRATASSGLPVEFFSISPSVCSVTGNTVTLRAVGTCAIEANQYGNASYGSASPVIQSFRVIIPNAADGDVPLPEWLLVLMSASLLGIVLRKQQGKSAGR